MTRDAVRSLALSCAFVAACAADVPTHETELQSDSDVALQISPLFPRIGDACNAEQASRIRAMADLALDYILDAQADLASVRSGGDTTRFDYWFGGHDPQMVAVVSKAFDRMVPWLSEVELQCGCPGAPPGTIAFATQNHPSKPVHLCEPALTWDYIEFGVGAILHEFSHLAGTQDWFRCSKRGSFEWPDELHDSAVAARPFATNSAENFRLYALDWQRGQPSSRACPPEAH